MSGIKLLDQGTIAKIAAGEVVERPASVVKELLENSIDASSSAITVEIKDGGVSFLRVTDNGSGIKKDELRLAFMRHATSKLREASDLDRIMTLGFRGEALASIAAVSAVEVITRVPEDITGIRMEIEGGEEKTFQEIGAPAGTTVIMRRLFYNTPARAKFLKSTASETNAISSIVEQLSLSRPDISFKYIVNGQQKLFTPGSGSLKDTVYSVYGREVTTLLIPVDIETADMRITGFIGQPETARASRAYENIFVNGRYVKDKIISKAVEDAYKGQLMQHRYPFTLLNFIIDASKVDVNVHPTKMNLRFYNEQAVYEQILTAVRKALFDNRRVYETSPSFIPESRPAAHAAAPKPYDTGTSGEYHPSAPEPFEEKRIIKERVERPVPSVPEYVREKPKQQSLFDDRNDDNAIKQPLIVIGQLFDTFILLQYGDEFYIMDQHAAHEKVMYEELMEKYNSHSITTQLLMPPIVLSLSSSECGLLEENLGSFTALGFEIEPFGKNEYRITGVPSGLFGLNVRDIFTEVLDGLSESSQTPLAITDKIASMSCKAAVKGNDALSRPEIVSLTEKLLTLKDPYHCPHGRPTMIVMSRRELEKKFKRII